MFLKKLVEYQSYEKNLFDLIGVADTFNYDKLEFDTNKAEPILKRGLEKFFSVIGYKSFKMKEIDTYVKNLIDSEEIINTNIHELQNENNSRITRIMKKKGANKKAINSNVIVPAIRKNNGNKGLLSFMAFLFDDSFVFPKAMEKKFEEVFQNEIKNSNVNEIKNVKVLIYLLQNFFYSDQVMNKLKKLKDYANGKKIGKGVEFEKTLHLDLIKKELRELCKKEVKNYVDSIYEMVNEIHGYFEYISQSSALTFDVNKIIDTCEFSDKEIADIDKKELSFYEKLYVMICELELRDSNQEYLSLYNSIGIFNIDYDALHLENDMLSVKMEGEKLQGTLDMNFAAVRLPLDEFILTKMLELNKDRLGHFIFINEKKEFVVSKIWDKIPKYIIMYTKMIKGLHTYNNEDIYASFDDDAISIHDLVVIIREILSEAGYYKGDEDENNIFRFLTFDEKKSLGSKSHQIKIRKIGREYYYLKFINGDSYLRQSSSYLGEGEFVAVQSAKEKVNHYWFKKMDDILGDEKSIKKSLNMFEEKLEDCIKKFILNV